MLKNISDKEAGVLTLLRGNEELMNVFDIISKDELTRELVIKLTSEEKKFISEIINNYQLRQEISNLGFSTILDYMEKKGFINLFGLFNKFESLLQSDYKNISKIEDIFSYIDFLLSGDMIIEAIQGTKISDKAKRSLTAIKKEVYEQELDYLSREVCDKREINEGLRRDNNQLSRSNSELNSKNNALLHSIKQLESTRNSLLNENESLRQQIDDNRIVLTSQLDVEIKALKKRRTDVLDAEIQEIKNSKEKELVGLNTSISNLKKDLEELDKVYSSYSSDYPINLNEEDEEEEFDVVWEPIDENHDIMKVKKKDIDVYYASVKDGYKMMTGRTDNEIEVDFTSRYSSLADFISFIKNTNESGTWKKLFGDDLTVKEIIDNCNEGLEVYRVEYREHYNQEYVREMYNLYKEVSGIISLIRVPKFVKKEKKPSYRDDINSLMLVIEAKKQIARANADKLIAEEALGYALKAFLNYLPEDVRIDYLTALDDGLSSSGKRLIRQLTD